jgi:hypothetical protein
MMNTKFKRHQAVKILVLPNPEYIEYHSEDEEKALEEKHPEIKKGMKGRINMILPNGQYHVELQDSKGNIIAYAAFSEEDLESLE